MAIDVSEARIVRLGMVEEELSAHEALTHSKNIIENMPNASVSYALIRNGNEHQATSFLNEEGGPDNPSRMIDMGRFTQRIDIPKVLYSGSSGINGSIQLSAMPRHFVLSQRATNNSSTEPLTLALTLSAEALSGLDQITWLDGERALKIEGENTPGWTFIIPETPGATAQIIVQDNGSLRFTNTYTAPQAGEHLKLPVLAIPANAGGEDQLQVWLNPGSAAQVEYKQLKLDGTESTGLENASWDPERGAFVVGLKNLSQAGAPGSQSWGDPNVHNWYNRHQLLIHNNTGSRVSIPIAFEGGNNAAFYIVGGSPLFRDTNGEPIGAPIQISKNWHEDPFWYHLYSQLEVEPGTKELEHTFAHSKWGEAFAAAHAQLSLIGWGKNQQWDESSLGAFGETITYDPDYTLGRAMVDDVRPFLVQSKNLWSWTGNVGGADFLVYGASPGENFAGHQLGRLRTHYQYTGPNLTKVLYAGISRDQKIEARITTQLGRTDDLVRAYYHLEYTFLEDVTYHRLALFQMAADRYGDNGFTRYAFGNESGVIFDQDVLNHGATGYASGTDRGIAIPGESPWVMLYNSQLTGGDLPEHLANIGFVIRDYHLQIGDESVTTPHINIVRTNNQQKSQMAFEVGLPYDSSNTVVPAGSVLKATVEYLVPPAQKSAYYGPSDHLAALPASSFEDTQMMLHLASGNDLEVETMTGSLVRTHPPEFEASQEDIALHFSLTGGLGYTPLTIRGLARPDGWRLERKNGETWETVDQSVHGNDYWQAYEASDSGRFHLIFNLKNQGTQEYRLLRN